MQKLAKERTSIIVEECSMDMFRPRVSDPFWFQALGCFLDYDWNSSSVITVLTAVLKNAIKSRDLGLTVCGGKKQDLPENAR
jgi:hypothetical protein